PPPLAPPAEATTADIGRYVLSIAAQDQVRTLVEEVGLSDAGAQAVVGLVARGGFARQDLLDAIGLGATLLLERHTAEWVLANPAPPTGALADGATTLLFANARTIDAATLTAAGLTPRAANGILARRAGPDGKYGTSDDRPFADPDGAGPLTGF